MAAVGQIPLSTLLAQTNAAPVSSTEDLFWRFANTVGAIGILAWYFYQTQTKTIPDKDKQIADERASSDAKIKATLEATDVKIKATLDATQLEMQHERETHKASVDRLVDELRAERESRMEIIMKCKGGQ
jgi:F0F1-type ATP synthase membrane subunit b/b'